MPPRPRLFIGSSSEGLRIARVIEELLSPDARVELWSSAFALGETTIEALKRASEESDFAVLLLTDDDRIVSRSKRATTPRDNVVFEAGLFIGGLGRDRCYLVHDHNIDLKLPTDLLGVTTASYKRHAKGGLRAALRPSCDIIREQVKHKHAREKLSQSEVDEMRAARRFSESIEGFWWCDRTWDRGNSVSFVRLSVDARNGMPKVNGEAWNGKGESVATWWSIASCVQPVGGQLYFNFEGYHPPPPSDDEGKKSEKYIGFSTYTFDMSVKSPKRGRGEISDLNVDRGEVRKILHLNLRRCTSRHEIGVMTHPERNLEQLAELVQKQLHRPSTPA